MTPKLALTKNHIQFYEQETTRQSVLEGLAGLLVTSGMVRESFCQAIQDREKSVSHRIADAAIWRGHSPYGL